MPRLAPLPAAAQTTAAAAAPRTNNKAEPLGENPPNPSGGCLPGDRPALVPTAHGCARLQHMEHHRTTRSRLNYAADYAPEVLEIPRESWRVASDLSLESWGSLPQPLEPALDSGGIFTEGEGTLGFGTRASCAARDPGTGGACRDHEVAAREFESVLSSSRQRRRVLRQNVARAAREDNRQKLWQRSAAPIVDVLGITAPLALLVGISMAQPML